MLKSLQRCGAPARASRGLRWLAAWSTPGLLRALQYVATGTLTSANLAAGPLFFYYLPFWWPWAFGHAALARLLRRLPPRTPASFAVHLLLSFGAAFLHLALLAAWNQLAAPRPPETLALSFFLLGISHWAVMSWLTYWLIVGIHQGIAFQRRSRQRQLQAAQLEARLAEARLEALQLQLHPLHLRTTLAAIGTLVEEGRPAEAVRRISRLADFLRQILAKPEAAG